jgi:hypothetical protein
MITRGTTVPEALSTLGNEHGRHKPLAPCDKRCISVE